MAKRAKKTSVKRTRVAPQRGYQRGSIVTVSLSRPFKFNGVEITTAMIEIDHINRGLDPQTGKLNTKLRSSFSTDDVEKFLFEVDGEFFLPEDDCETRFVFDVNCPILGLDYATPFRMVVETSEENPQLIHTITLFKVNRL